MESVPAPETSVFDTENNQKKIQPQTPVVPSTGYARPPTSSIFSRGSLISSRIGNDKFSFARPSTAVRAVGYTADSEKLLDQAFLQKAKQQQALSATTEPTGKDANPLLRYRHLEAKISSLLEASILLSAETQPNYAEALNKAKEAFSLDRTLHRLRDQYGENLSHNCELTYAVFFNLAEQYTNNDLFVEALNSYSVMIKNKMFPHVSFLKLNMGNIYFKMGIYKKAIKMYRMALDSVPSNHKQLRLKITQNIGILLVKMGQYSDAATSFEYVMSDRPEIRSGIHLAVCYYAMNEVDRLRNAFKLLVDIPLENEDDVKAHTYIEENEDTAYVFELLKTDELATYNKHKKNSIKKSITMLVDLISPVIEENYNDGYYWCIEVIKASASLSWLANDLELNKALVYLRQNDINQAIETLRTYEKKDDTMAGNALTNLSFIYLQIGDLENARQCTNQFLNDDRNNPNAFINSAIVDMRCGDFNNAKEKLLNALELQPNSFEANYNLGLVMRKAENEYNHEDLSDDQFVHLSQEIQHPHVHYQLARIHEFTKSPTTALEIYLQVLGTTGEMDSKLFEKFANLYESFGDHQEANQCYNEAFRLNSSDINIACSIGSYYIKLQALEKGLYYFERTVLADPNEPNYQLRIAHCYRHILMPKNYLELFEKIYAKFPKNLTCLRALVHVTKSVGMMDLHEKYSLEYARLEKTTQDIRQSSAIGSAKSRIKRRSGALQRRDTATPMPHVQYVDPLGPPAERPRTGAVTRSSDNSDDDDNAELLLPI